jgi:pentatricopeptide repeat protein
MVAELVGTSYGRLLALLAAGSGDIAAAEDAITDPAVQRFQPAWTTRAHLLARAGRFDEARSAYRRAIELTKDRGVADYLRDRLEYLVAC